MAATSKSSVKAFVVLFRLNLTNAPQRAKHDKTRTNEEGFGTCIIPCAMNILSGSNLYLKPSSSWETTNESVTLFSRKQREVRAKA
jgi:hypothetical protein